jgi:hypothetical protein
MRINPVDMSAMTIRGRTRRGEGLDENKPGAVACGRLVARINPAVSAMAIRG